LPFEANGFALAITAAVLFGAGTVSARKTLVGANSNVGAMISVTSAIPLLLVFEFLNGEFSLLDELTLVPFFVLAIAGFLHFFLGRMVQYQAIKEIGANRAHSISNTFPIYSSIMAVAFLGEVVTLNKLLAVGTVVVGATLLGSDRSRSRLTNVGGRSKHGVGLALFSGVLFGFSQFLTRVGVGQTLLPITGVVISYSFATMSFLTYFASPASGHENRLSASTIGIGIRGFVLSGFFLALAQVCSYTALSSTQVTVVSPILASQPLFTILLTYLTMRRMEVFHFRLLAGAVLVIGGVILLYLPPLIA
jgi:drug/metabolite transporter (DMT)-like permease